MDSDPVQQLLYLLLEGALSPLAVMLALGWKHRHSFKTNYLRSVFKTVTKATAQCQALSLIKIIHVKPLKQNQLASATSPATLANSLASKPSSL